MSRMDEEPLPLFVLFMLLPLLVVSFTFLIGEWDDILFAAYIFTVFIQISFVFAIYFIRLYRKTQYGLMEFPESDEAGKRLVNIIIFGFVASMIILMTPAMLIKDGLVYGLLGTIMFCGLGMGLGIGICIRLDLKLPIFFYWLQSACNNFFLYISYSFGLIFIGLIISIIGNFLAIVHPSKYFLMVIIGYFFMYFGILISGFGWGLFNSLVDFSWVKKNLF